MITQEPLPQTPGGKHRRRLAIAGAALLMAAVFFSGIGIGYGMAHRRSGELASLQLPAGSASAAPASCDETELTGAKAQLYPEFALFWEAMDLLYRDFYGERPDPQEATYTAINSVINLFDDPNTSFLTPADAEQFRATIEGSFEGIGARVAWDETADTIRITEPFENQPAWNAGLRRGDLILAVDGEILAGIGLSAAVNKVRGPKGSVVILTIERNGGAPFDIEITRDRIEVPTVSTDGYGEDGEIAYVRLNTFNENAGQLVRQAVRDAVQRGSTSLIFDLRGNSGGLLREAVRVTSVFVEDNTVLLERFGDGVTQTYETAGRAVALDLPMVVLVNGGSASASEIVAGALQDSGRALLVGETTFGKGSVQLPHTLSNGGIMRVTVARWFTPNQRSIDGVGLQPDILVALTNEQIEAHEDPQLDAAVEFLLSSASNE
jgi:carboxyl-terminal processing protease